MITPINTLDLLGEDLIDDAKLAHILEKNESSTGVQRWVATLPLANRDLTGADLSQADVRHVDFSDAILNRANLTSAWAKEAQFDQARLKGASLGGGQLQGASLVSAQLQGTWLDSAQLQGTSLDNAQLQGASLAYAQLQGASLFAARLQGATLYAAQLQGAFLDWAQLQGASLAYAQLQGASLDQTQLQGALLDKAQLQGASFVDVCVWRADARQAVWNDTRVAGPETRPKADKNHECDWMADSFAALKQLLPERVPENGNSGAALAYAALKELGGGSVEKGAIEQRLDPTKTLEGEDEMTTIWAARERESPTPEAYAKSLTEQWRETGCAAEGAPYVLHALIARLSNRVTSPFRDQSGWAKELASDFLYEDCAGALGLSEADKAKLKKIAPVRLRAPMR